MNMGEKIREARKIQGLSQEQLAEKLSVSRSAVAKWETGKGLPDVGNLKMLSRLLHISVDHLLDEEEVVIREAYDPDAWGYGCKKVRKDRFLRSRFPDAAIYTLLGRREPPAPGKLTRRVTDCRTAAPDPLRETDKAFYLVEREGQCFFVTVTDAYLEIRPLEQPPDANRFTLDGWTFIKYNYEIG